MTPRSKPVPHDADKCLLQNEDTSHAGSTSPESQLPSLISDQEAARNNAGQGKNFKEAPPQQILPSRIFAIKKAGEQAPPPHQPKGCKKSELITEGQRNPPVIPILRIFHSTPRAAVKMQVHVGSFNIHQQVVVNLVGIGHAAFPGMVGGGEVGHGAVGPAGITRHIGLAGHFRTVCAMKIRKLEGVDLTPLRIPLVS